MGENEQGGMLRTVVVVGLVALIAAVITMGVVGMKASMIKNTDRAVSAIVKENGQQVDGRNYFIMNTAVSAYLSTDGKALAANATNADMTSDFIAVSPNETWQLTSWLAPNMNGNIIYTYYDANKTYIDNSRVLKWLYATNDPITTSITIPDGVAYMRVSSQHMGGNQGAKVKVEKGTKPTGWTPSPED